MQLASFLNEQFSDFFESSPRFAASPRSPKPATTGQQQYSPASPQWTPQYGSKALPNHLPDTNTASDHHASRGGRFPFVSAPRSLDWVHEVQQFLYYKLDIQKQEIPWVGVFGVAFFFRMCISQQKGQGIAILMAVVKGLQTIRSILSFDGCQQKIVLRAR